MAKTSLGFSVFSVRGATNHAVNALHGREKSLKNKGLQTSNEESLLYTNSENSRR